MSETQLKVTGKHQAADDDGNSYIIYEYTVFSHTTTAEMSYGASPEKAYKLADGAALDKIGETEFKIGSTGIKIHLV